MSFVFGVRLAEARCKRRKKNFGAKTVKKLRQNSAETLKTFFHALHVPPRFCAADDCLVTIYVTQKREANSNCLPPEMMKISRMLTNVYRTGQSFVVFILDFVII